METPYGFCQCGCNQKTNIIPDTVYARGLKKGEPYRFLLGHGTRSSPVDYILEDRGFSTPCWIWQLATDKDGYGQKKVKGKQTKAHRFFYEQKYGPIQEGFQPDHLCRVHPCVNPDHLEPVTCAENSRRGVNAKLTAADVREIRSMSFARSGEFRGKMTQTAARFGVSPSTICTIIKRKAWVDIT